MTEIGGDWGGQFRPVNAVPMCQFRPNLRPIETPFWIGKISSILENRGQSYAMQEPIRCQSWLSQTDNLLPIQCQSVTTELPIRCQSQATGHLTSIPDPVPIHHQSIADRMSIDLQSCANLVPIQCQSDVIPRPMGHRA